MALPRDPEEFLAKAVLHAVHCEAWPGLSVCGCGAVVGGVGSRGRGWKCSGGVGPGAGKEGRRREDTLELKPEAAQAPRFWRYIQFGGSLLRKNPPSFTVDFFLRGLSFSLCSSPFLSAFKHPKVFPVFKEPFSSPLCPLLMSSVFAFIAKRSQ